VNDGGLQISPDDLDRVERNLQFFQSTEAECSQVTEGSLKQNDEETFHAQLEVGRRSILLDEPMENVLKELLAAYEMRPSRAEPLYELARYFRLQNMFNHGYIYAAVGSTMPRPDDSLFVQSSVYDWKMLNELCVLAYWAGKMHEGKSVCEEILYRVNDGGLQISPDDLDRVERNLQFFQSTEAECSQVTEGSLKQNDP
jgi:hypothetical protein